MGVVLRTPLFRRMTAVVVVVGASDGLSAITVQYLQMRVRFGARQLSAYLVVVGVCGLLVQSLLMLPLLRLTGERGAIACGLAGQLVRALGWRQWGVRLCRVTGWRPSQRARRGSCCC